MLSQFNIWEFLAGLGIFLLAMVLLEEALELLAGRSFKKFLRKHTENPLKAILNGTILTAVLQSSSVVSLMVLAFVGAGIIELHNAIGIIIGSNLGTTFTGWIVAYFGFGFNIESFAFPFIAFGGLSMVFFSKPEKLHIIGQLLVGMGFLFLGLEYMKSSIAYFATHFDISPYSNLSPYYLFIVGFILTAIIQSSSAAMVITLSALNAELITLEAAAAMVIGSDLGTTITVVLGGIKGSPSKKRVAFSHFLFNLVIDILALLFLFPLITFISKIMGDSNPMLTLVAFHSSFNLAGIVLFLPFLGIFARFLERRFQKDSTKIARFITQVPVSVTEAAISVLEKEIQHLIERIFNFHVDILALNKSFLPPPSDPNLVDASITEQYELIKELEGEITSFYIQLQGNKLNEEESEQLRQLIHSVRFAMSAAKDLKDINHNIQGFYKSVNDNLLQLLNLIKENQQTWYQSLYHSYNTIHTRIHFESLADLKKVSKRNYDQFLETAYHLIKSGRFSELEISTLFNVNREIHASNKALISAIKDLLLEKVQADDFDALSDNLE